MTNRRSDEAKAYRRLYGLKAWKVARETQLSREPLCERCRRSEDIVSANVVNHRVPHKGDWELFIDPDNHESLCEAHHNSLVQREEKRGYEIGSDIDGRPVDPGHPWNRPSH